MQLAASLCLFKVSTTAFRVISELRRTVKEVALIVVRAAEPHAASGTLGRSDLSHQQLLASNHSSRFVSSHGDSMEQCDKAFQFSLIHYYN